MPVIPCTTDRAYKHETNEYEVTYICSPIASKDMLSDPRVSFKDKVTCIKFNALSDKCAVDYGKCILSNFESLSRLRSLTIKKLFITCIYTQDINNPVVRSRKDTGVIKESIWEVSSIDSIDL
jgi:hypothetical protein